jgi:2-hydroxyglutarate dehydrogenase
MWRMCAATAGLTTLSLRSVVAAASSAALRAGGVSIRRLSTGPVGADAGTECTYDVAIVGGGIVGLATARRLLQTYPSLTVCVVEKESALGQHQTSHNSGVIHAGIYYAPGSLRARLSVRGSALMYRYCALKGIRADRVGKLIVAVQRDELPRLQAYYERSIQNGVPGVEMKTAQEITQVNCCAALR